MRIDNVLILAGGSGSRLLPLQTPKPLFSFAGKPLLLRLIDDLTALNLNKITVVCNPAYKQLYKSALGTNLNLIFQSREKPGMAGAVLSAKHLLTASPVLIIDGAKYLSTSLRGVVDEIRENRTKICLTAIKTPENRPGGYFVAKGKTILSIHEKPARKPSNLYRIVVDYFPSGEEFALELDKAELRDDSYEQALSRLLKQTPSNLCLYRGEYSSLKYPHHVLELANLILHQLGRSTRSASVARSARIIGKVKLGKDVRVFDHATIIGPSYIGDGTTVRTGALVRESMIENDCTIGFSSEVSRSYLGPRTKLHHAFVGDSIIEGDCNLAWGTALANRRFDGNEVKYHSSMGKIGSLRKKFGSIIGSGVQSGINSSFMPGTVVGSGSIIGSGCVVKGNLAEGTVVESRFSYA